MAHPCRTEDQVDQVDQVDLEAQEDQEDQEAHKVAHQTEDQDLQTEAATQTHLVETDADI